MNVLALTIFVILWIASACDPRSSKHFLSRSFNAEKREGAGGHTPPGLLYLSRLEPEAELASAIQMNGDNSPRVEQGRANRQTHTSKRECPKNDRPSAVAAGC